MYVKIHQGVVQKYPYSIEALRADNPQVSFPEVPPESLLASWGVFPVNLAPAPVADHTKNVWEGTPEKSGNNKWVQTWVVTDASPREISERTAQKALEVRKERQTRLDESDWTQMADVAVSNSAAWKSYRQALRDITRQPGFPWTINWPAKPF